MLMKFSMKLVSLGSVIQGNKIILPPFQIIYKYSIEKIEFVNTYYYHCLLKIS